MADVVSMAAASVLPSLKQSFGMHKLGNSTPLPYTASLLELLAGDVLLIKNILLYFPISIPGVLRPFWSLNPQDELCLLNPGNVRSLALHLVLIPAQIAFLLSLFYALLFPIPAAVYVGGIIISLVLNYCFCILLNQDGEPFASSTDLSAFPRHDDEAWIFINGVSVGRQWFQANLDLLSNTFGRKIIGIHNPTYGIVFDLLECILQRDCNFVTDDIRRGYAQVKKSLLDSRNRKVILMAHSQGGIEAGAILDWLLDDLPYDMIRKLEIYTFGSAANHFNNPLRTAPGPRTNGSVQQIKPRGVVKHIEHYTNSGEFVARFGILGFVQLPPNTSLRGDDKRVSSPISSRPPPSPSLPTDPTAPPKPGMTRRASVLYKRQHNRFNGVLFNFNAPGHMLNQHYLSAMFARETYTRPDGTVADRVADSNDWMDSTVSSWDQEKEGHSWGWPWQRRRDVGDIHGVHERSGAESESETNPETDPETEAEECRKGRGDWTTMVLENGSDVLAATASAGPRPSDGSLVETSATTTTLRPRDICRLWRYRNGMSPVDDDDDDDEEDRRGN